eukprot:127007_1
MSFRLAKQPVCILGAGKSLPNSIVTSNDSRNLVKVARDYALKNHINNPKDEKILYSVSDWLIKSVDKLLINTKHAALDTSQYESLQDYWYKSNYQVDMVRFYQNRASPTVQNSIISSCHNAMLSTGLHLDLIKSKITHVLVHTDMPGEIPPISSSLIAQLELDCSTHPISVANHGCCGPHVVLEIAKSICKCNENALVLCHLNSTPSTYLNWFNQISEIKGLVQSRDIRSHFIGSLLLGDMFCSLLIGRPQPDVVYNYPLFTINNTYHYQIPNTATGFLGSSSIGNNVHIDSELKKLLIWGLQVGINWQDIFSQCIGADHDDICNYNECEYSFHAGGKSIIEAFETGLQSKGVTDIENRMKIVYDILWKYGNVGCCSSVLSLDETLRNTKKDNVCHIGCGPGIGLYFHGFTRLDKYLCK